MSAVGRDDYDATAGATGDGSLAAWGETGGAFSRILVPIDGGASSSRALERAAELAQREGAELALLAVADVRLTHASEAGIPPVDLLASLRREARSLLLHASLTLPPAVHAAELLHEGVPADEIVAAARAWRADLIVLGRRGHAGLTRVLAGGTADAVLRRAPCPVLVVRQTPVIAPGAAGGWRSMLRWARLKDEPGCPGHVTA